VRQRAWLDAVTNEDPSDPWVMGPQVRLWREGQTGRKSFLLAAIE